MGSDKLKVVFFLAVLIFLPIVTIYPQHISRDNYTGMWNSPSSWLPEWPLPVHDSLNFDITINGYITLEGKLSFANFNTVLTVNDTLVIKSDLVLGNRNQLNVTDNGILIIKGNLVINNKTLITSNGYIVVSGNIVKVGSINQGSFTSNDNPAKVFIGGSVPAILSDVPAYPVLDSVAPLPKTGYPASGAGYGNMTDILGDPILAFLNSLCPVKKISCNSPVCEGQAIKLESSGGMAYHWTGPGGFDSNEQNPVISGSAIAMSGIYSVIFSGEPGCPNETKTVNVLVNQLPAAMTSVNNPVCEGDTIKLSATGGTDFNWSGPGGFTGSSQSISLPGADLSRAGTYNVIVTGANGCSSSAAAILVVNSLPVVNLTGNSPVCAGAALNFSASGGTGYAWSGPGGFGSSESSVSRINAEPAMSGVYTVLVTNANGCKINKSISLTVNSLPVPVITSNSPVCEGGSVNLLANGATDYLWTGPGGFTANGNNLSRPDANTSMSGTYTVSVTDGNGCSSVATSDFIVNQLPSVTITNNSPVCAGTNLVFSAEGGTGFLWNGPAGFTSTSQSVTRSNADQGMSGAYTVVVTDANGCKSNKSVNLTVNSLPAVTIQSNGPVCAGGQIILSAQGGTTYLWTGPDGFSGSGSNISIADALTSMSGAYKLKVTDLNGCESTGQINVIVNPIPAVSIEGLKDRICTGDKLLLVGNPSGGVFNIISGPGSLSGNTLTGKTPGTINFEYIFTAVCPGRTERSLTVLDRPVAFAGPDQNLKFTFETKMDALLGASESGSWTLKSGTGKFDDELSPASVVRRLSVGENVFKWKVSNGTCFDSSLVRINVADMFIPSVITPDGDGKNDYFIIGAPEGHTRLVILDKWGNQEYRSDNYLNNWDGRNNKGEELSEDTYFYILEYNSSIIRKGTILILR